MQVSYRPDKMHNFHERQAIRLIVPGDLAAGGVELLDLEETLFGIRTGWCTVLP
jgi:hypothetical protein